jgi:hypothetical protein
LAHFGAFLARPFREHDFYVGVYDALNFSADRLCNAAKSRTARSQTEYRALCHADAFHRLMHHVDVGCTGHLMVEQFYEREHHLQVGRQRDGATDCAAIPDERRRNAMLLMIADAFRETKAAAPRCTDSYNPFEDVMCSSGITGFTTLARQRGLNDSVRVYVDDKSVCQETYTVVDSLASACFVDDYFRRFVENPKDFIKRLAFLGMARAVEVERVAQQNEGSGYATAQLGIANPILRSLLGTPTTAGFEWDQGTTPRECADGNLYPRFGNCSVAQALFRVAVPYYVAGGFGSTMLETGIRPAYHQDAATSIVFPLSLHYGRVPTESLQPGDPLRRRSWFAAGVGAMWRNHRKSVNECLVSASWRTRTPWDRDVVIPNDARRLYRRQCDLLASRFPVGVTSTALNDSDWTRWSLVIGLADFNGLLYWLLPHGSPSR